MSPEEREKLFGREVTSEEVGKLFPEALAAWRHEVRWTKFKIHTNILSATAIGAGFVWEDGRWQVL